MVSLCWVFSHSPCPAGYMPPVCSNVPGCGPLSREFRTSVAAKLPSGTKLVWMRSHICHSLDIKTPFCLCLSLYLLLIVPLNRAPLLYITHGYTNTDTHLCLLKERERGWETIKIHTGHRDLHHLLPCVAFSPPDCSRLVRIRLKIVVRECQIIHSWCFLLEIFRFQVAHW